ncbi:MAG: tetratricopeptide repeat protein [bacterium]
MTDRKIPFLFLYAGVLIGVFLFQYGVALCSAQISDENSLYAVALGAYKDGFYDLAIDQFSQLLRVYPDCPKAPYAQFRIAEAYFKQKKYNQAILHYQRLLDRYPQKSELLDKALYRMGQTSFFKGEYEKAGSFYQRLLSGYPDSELTADALFWSAESNSQAGAWKEALSPYQKFLGKYPGHSHAAEAQYGLGLAYLKLRDYGRAIKTFRELMDKHPKNKQLVSKALLNSADIEYRQGEYEKAALDYQKFVRDYPDYSDARSALYGAGLSFYQAKQFPKAVALYKQFLGKYPKDDLAESVSFQSGFMLFKLEDYSPAAAQLDDFIRKYGESSYVPEAYYYLALSNQKLEKRDLAEQQLIHITKECKNSPIASSAWLQLGTLYYQAQKFLQAAEAYKSASGSADRSVAAEALYWLGESYASQKNYDKAIHTFLQIPQQYAGIANWAVMAQMRLAGIYEHLKEYSKALELYETVAKNQKEDYFRQSAQQRIEKLRSQTKETP